MFNWFDSERFLHSVKTVIAVFIGFLLTRLIGPSAHPWVVISILIVMCAQMYVGSVVQKAYLRFLGTLAGCLFATLTIIATGASEIAIIITICLSSFIFSYLAVSQEEVSYACTLGAVTTAIILLTPKPTIPLAGSRFMEISLGLLIAALASQFLFPIHARKHLRREQARALTFLRSHYQRCMLKNTATKRDALYVENDDENIVKALSKQRQLTKEAARELLGEAFDPEAVMQLLQSEKEILRAIDFMDQALQALPQDLLPLETLLPFHESVIQALTILILHEAEDKDATIKLALHLPSVAYLKNRIDQLVFVDQKQMVAVYGFLFAAEILTQSLQKTATLYQISVITSPSD